MSFNTKEITICLHASNPAVGENQMALLAPLKNHVKVNWNNRWERHIDTYPSYSQLVNDAVSSSPTEMVVLVNDRLIPQYEEVLQMIRLQEMGFAVSTKYSVGFMTLTKEVFRCIGWFDERFYGGGYEDDDFVLRLRLHDLAYYESHESIYNQTWKTQAQPRDGLECVKSKPHFFSKWKFSDTEVVRVLPEESYPKYESLVGPSKPEIRSIWMPWKQSILGVEFNCPHKIYEQKAGPSRTFWFMESPRIPYKEVRTVKAND